MKKVPTEILDCIKENQSYCPWKGPESPGEERRLLHRNAFGG